MHVLVEINCLPLPSFSLLPWQVIIQLEDSFVSLLFFFGDIILHFVNIFGAVSRLKTTLVLFCLGGLAARRSLATHDETTKNEKSEFWVARIGSTRSSLRRCTNLTTRTQPRGEKKKKDANCPPKAL